MPDSLLHRFVLAGGVVMVFLVPCAVLAVAFAVQGFVNLRRSRTNPAGFVRELWDARRSGAGDAALAVLEREAGRHSLAAIVRNTLAAREASPATEPVVLLREQIADETDRLLHENSQLGILYRLCPLIGLVGTILGMIRAFMEFSLSPEPRIENLAAGVMTALVATAWGIGIACFSFLFFSIHQRRVFRLEQFDFIFDGELALHAVTGEPVGTSLRTARERNLLA